MNKKKSLLLAILSFVAVFALAFSFGCKNGNGEDNSGNKVNPDDDVLSGKYEDEDDEPLTPADGWVLQSILLNVEGVKTEYAYGEEFDTSKKPAVSAKYASVESLIKYEETKHLITGAAELEYKTETVTDVKVDYGQYNKDAVGTYVIYVSYTHANVTRSANYEVKVVGVTPAIGGITIELKEGFDTEYYISGPEGVNIENISEGFSVYNVDANLEVDRTEEIPAKAEETDGYTLSYFKNGEKIDNLQGLQKGVYTVYATYNSTSAFFFIEILDPVTEIELKADDETAVFTQVQSPVESMTSTWNFVVTYNSGLTKEVKKGDAGLLIGSIITVLPAENSVTVAYTEDGETKTVSVPYTVTKNEKLLNEKKEFNREALGIASGDTDLTQEHLTGDNSFLKKGENSNVVLKYRPKQDNGCLEIRNDALNIEFYGFGTLMVSARSTGSSNKSAIALKNADGEYISAVYDVTDANIKEGTTKDGNVYMVSGDMQKRPAPTPEDPNKTETVPYMARILTFIVPEAGVYTLCTVDSVTVEDESAPIATGRNTRVYKIEKTDVFDASIDRTNYEFEINTDNVKTEYIAGETEISKAGLTAEFREVHTVDTDKNKTVNLTADDLTVKLTSGDLSKLNSKGTVQVSYKANGTEYKKTYEIAIKSPVAVNGEDVNSVKAVKAQTAYDLAEGETFAAIKTDDIELHANTASGEIITINGTDNTVVYKLYSGNTEITTETWEAEAGTYKIVGTVTLKNNKTVEGVTEFTVEITVKVNEYVPAGDANEHEEFFLENVGSAEAFTATAYEAGAEIASNTLFALNAGSAKMTTSIGGAYGNIQNNNGSNKVEFTDTESKLHNPDIGIALESNAYLDEWFTVTAKENITLTLYVTYANKVYNSNKVATLSYAVNGTVAQTKEITARKTVWAVTAELNKDDVLTFKTAGTAATPDGMGWLFGAEAQKKAGGEEAPKEPVSINFNGLTAGELTANTQLTFENCPSYLTDVQILAAADKNVTVTAQANTVGGVDTVNYIKTNGTSSASARSIGFTLAAGNYTVTVYEKSGSSSDTTMRFVQLFDGDTNPTAQTAAGNSIEGFSFDVSGGAYQVGSSNKGMSIYLIVITPKA